MPLESAPVDQNGQQKEEIIRALNQALAQEHTCYIRYSTHATVVSGPYADTVSARLREIASDEAKHAQKLRDHIDNLGGDPTLEVDADSLNPARDLAEILTTNLAEEENAISMYKDLRPFERGRWPCQRLITSRGLKGSCWGLDRASPGRDASVILTCKGAHTADHYRQRE